MPAAIRPYSIAVAPDSLRTNRFIIAFIDYSDTCFHMSSVRRTLRHDPSQADQRGRKPREDCLFARNRGIIDEDVDLEALALELRALKLWETVSD